MTPQPARGTVIVILTLVLSMALMVLPLPELLSPYRLQWTTLVLIYWWLALPQRVGILSAFVCGILLDVLTGTIIGQHAFALAVIAYITVEAHQQIRLYPLLQQALVVVVLLGLERLLQFLVLGILGSRPEGFIYWAPPLLGGALWPWLYIVLRDVRRRFQIR